MKRLIPHLLSTFIIIGLYSSCDGSQKDIEGISGPQVNTLDAIQGPLRVVTISGQVKGLDAVANDYECGIEYSTRSSFAKDSTWRVKANVNYSEETYSVILSSIESARKYYYRAYCVNNLMSYYGETKDFSFTWDTGVDYEQLKEREALQIRQWLSDNQIDVITLSDFLSDTVTSNAETGPDITRNEYVLFDASGVYMQIIRRGEGRIIGDDEMWRMNARYVERYIGSGDTLTMNLYQQDPDVFYVKRTGNNYAASFISGIMASVYGISVPSSWTIMIPYIKPGYLNGSSSAKVRLIVPHSQGTQVAAKSVYPTLYEIIITTQK